MNLTAYPSILTLGHKHLAGLFDGPVLVEEKIDGSQFSFGLIGGKLLIRSKSKEMSALAPEKMFAPAVAYVRSIEHLLVPGWVYRGEYLQKPKHNCLTYGRIPKNHIMIFDITSEHGNYLAPANKAHAASHIGLETVPKLTFGALEPHGLEDYFKFDSVLGGCKIEGIVVKNYAQRDAFGQILIGKFVCPAFKEKMERKPVVSQHRDEFIASLGQSLCTEARWRKARAHLYEAGELQETPEDIGPILREINHDVLKEETDAIKDVLFKHFWPQISRGITKGFPEWYKQFLMERAAEHEDWLNKEESWP